MVIHLIWPSVLMMILCVLFHFKFRIWLASISPLILLLLMLPWFISSLRTFVFDADGCTVCLWKYRKHYKWDDLQLKQYVSYKGAIITTTKACCYEAAEFCPKNVHVPKRLDGHAYSSIFHPLCFIFVYFPPGQPGFPVAYREDKAYFCKKLEEWGVKMRLSERGSDAYDPHWKAPERK